LTYPNCDACSSKSSGILCTQLCFELVSTYSVDNAQGDKDVILGGLDGLTGPFDVYMFDKTGNLLLSFDEGVEYGEKLCVYAANYSNTPPKFDSETSICVYDTIQVIFPIPSLAIPPPPHPTPPHHHHYPLP
jgi:hypothetical protein